MHKMDFTKVVFHSKEDLATGHYLQICEHILKTENQEHYSNVNEILELHNIKLYIDNDLSLKRWTQQDKHNFKLKVREYGSIVGRFMSKINDENAEIHCSNLLGNYVRTFWKLINNQKIYKQISKKCFNRILTNNTHWINEIITNKELVEYYAIEIKDALLIYSQSAEILLSIYEVDDETKRIQRYLPPCLSLDEKENILVKYLDSSDVNINYIGLIQNVRNRSEFRVSDKTRLKAKRLLKTKTDALFEGNNGLKYGVSINFPEKATKIKDGIINDRFVVNYSYSLDFIKENSDIYSLFQNFILLFEYLDPQFRISLVSKKNKLGAFEKIMGVHSQNEYRVGTEFNLLEMTSHIQMVGYCKILSQMDIKLENILYQIFTSHFHERYGFAKNARFVIPTATTYFEKVRLLAPEFESVLKQFKLFVENGSIDFELLQMSSNPSSIKDIPSLNKKKYLYINEENKEFVGCMNMLFSDQSSLAYIEPLKDKQYQTFFDIIANEKLNYTNFQEYQKPFLEILIHNRFISIDDADTLQIENPLRIIILRDLYINEVASFHRYSYELRQEAQLMHAEKIVKFGNSLFSKPEQAYLNFFLNKSDFTNGLDLRNSYLHGTQGTPEEKTKHEYSYFTYLKLLTLTLLKLEDDLIIFKAIKNRP